MRPSPRNAKTPFHWLSPRNPVSEQAFSLRLSPVYYLFPQSWWEYCRVNVYLAFVRASLLWASSCWAPSPAGGTGHDAAAPSSWPVSGQRSSDDAFSALCFESARKNVIEVFLILLTFQLRGPVWVLQVCHQFWGQMRMVRIPLKKLQLRGILLMSDHDCKLTSN